MSKSTFLGKLLHTCLVVMMLSK